MSATLNLSASKLEGQQGLIETLADIDQAARMLGIQFFIIGAAARDLILEHGHGAPFERATRDVDFAAQVADWAEFKELKTALQAAGFSASGQSQHRLVDPRHRLIDIIPFGPITENQQLAWPPDNDIVMSVAGFDEAFEAAVSVQIDELVKPLNIRVASVAGIALMKLIAWQEREPSQRRNDAQDLAYLCQHYHRIDDIHNQLFEQNIMAAFDWQIETASSYKLGADSATLSKPATRDNILSLFKRPFAEHGFDRLVADAVSKNIHNEALTRATLTAFKQGFRAACDI